MYSNRSSRFSGTAEQALILLSRQTLQLRVLKSAELEGKHSDAIIAAHADDGLQRRRGDLSDDRVERLGAIPRSNGIRTAASQEMGILTEPNLSTSAAGSPSAPP